MLRLKLNIHNACNIIEFKVFTAINLSFSINDRDLVTEMEFILSKRNHVYALGHN